MITRKTETATTDLRAAGYTIVPYPDAKDTTSLIVRLGERTVTTLPVKDGGVDEASVSYLIHDRAEFHG